MTLFLSIIALYTQAHIYLKNQLRTLKTSVLRKNSIMICFNFFNKIKDTVEFHLQKLKGYDNSDGPTLIVQTIAHLHKYSNPLFLVIT